MALRIDAQAEPITGYKLIERLGSGGFGEVWKAEAPGGIFKAVKIVHGNLDCRENDGHRFAEQELKALKRVKQVRHPYLLAMDRYDIVDGRLMIVMELADCNLWDRFRQCRKLGHQGIPRAELMQYMAESAEVLDLMNDQFQLQHLDIKPQNLFLLYNHVKVADFGQVKDLEGMIASVTGGITPVYAAPETFDGFVSRFCDQYSLACVYQELLTGQRPFDGNSMQQLLMQHLQMPPNLSPSPPSDRPALARALAKRPEDRFPSITAMVNALKAGDAGPGRTPVTVHSPSSLAVSALTGMLAKSDAAESDQIKVFLTSDVLAASKPGSGSVSPTAGPAEYASGESTQFPIAAPRLAATIEPDRPAPPEVTGPGSLQPALILGLGYTGLRVVQRFRKQLADRFGPAHRTPTIRTVYIDTDPDAVSGAASEQPWAGLAGLTADEVYDARLNRSAHYLNPRSNGRTVLEGWFDPSLLYKLPRNPQTVGLRAFGRLAFCDHYRNLMQKVEVELATALNPMALTDTQESTGLDIRTNRPRVYVVAGLGGGTGSGMFLDVAYAVRARLKRWGYSDPDVVGLLFLPPDGLPGEVSQQAQANTYAAITELHHYSRPESMFSANYDDPSGGVRDTGAPFRQVYLLPGLAHPPVVQGGSNGGTSLRGASGTIAASQLTRGASGTIRSGTSRIPPPQSGVRATPTSRPTPDRRGGGLDGPGRDPTALAAEFLRLDLLTAVGRTADAARPPAVPGHFRTIGLSQYTWPRAAVVARCARVVASVLFNNWIVPDPNAVRTTIPAWSAELWIRLGLDLDSLQTRLAEAGAQALGGPVEAALAALTDPLSPKKGWLTRLPEPAATWKAVEGLQKMLGRPQEPSTKSIPPLEESLALTADGEASAAYTELLGLLPGLVETPLFRLAGTEEAVRQLLIVLDRNRQKAEQHATAAEAAAVAAFETLVGYANQNAGRKLSASEYTDALRGYPAQQYRWLLSRSAVRCYKQIREGLIGLLNEVSNCRQRLAACQPVLLAEADIPADPPVPGEMLPPGCPSTEEAAQTFLRSLGDEDLQNLDERAQSGLERVFGGLYQACLNSADGHEGVLRVLREEARGYLNGRLGEVDLAAMFTQHYGRGTTGAVIARGFEAAAPTLIVGGPWAQTAIGIFGLPAGEGGEPIRQAAAHLLNDQVLFAEVPDEVVLYRELPDVPLVAVPQLGPSWAAAYRAAPELQQVTPHSRLDVTQWTDVDSV